MALAIDGSTPALATQTSGTTATVTTASFTPPAGALLLVMWAGNSALGVSPGSPTITDNLGSHLTYTLLDWQSRASSPTRDGQTAIWSAVVGSSAAMTVTVTNAAASGAREAALRVVVITGQDATPIGTHSKTGSTGASSIAQGFTGTAASSWGFLADCDWDTKGTQTAGTGCTVLSAGTVTTAISYGFVRRTTADGTNGGTTTMNVTLPGSSTNLGWCWAEVVPATSSSVTGDVTFTETFALSVDATVTPAPLPPVVASFTTAAVAAARARAGRGQVTLIRTPPGTAFTGDAALTETFALSADATRAATSDVTIAEAFGLAATATRAATADASVPSVFGLSVDASTSSATNPAPAGFDFTDAAVVAARAAYARPVRPTVLRTPPAGTSATADATITEAFGLSVAATRAATADATVASAFGLSVDATTGGASPQPAAFDFTDAASAAALWYRSRVVEPVITRPPGVASSSPTGDVTLTETFGLSVAATRATTGDVAIAEAFGLSVDATRAATAGATVPETFALTADATRNATAAVSIAETFALSATATVSTPGTGQVTITETFGLTTTAALGAVAAGTIPETFGLTTSATRATAGAALLAETFALTADAARGAVATTTVGSTFGLTVAAIITTGFPAEGVAGPGVGATVRAGPGAGVSAVKATAGGG